MYGEWSLVRLPLHWWKMTSYYGCSFYNRPNSQIPQCACPINHDAPFRREILLQLVHCAIWDRCIVGSLNLVQEILLWMVHCGIGTNAFCVHEVGLFGFHDDIILQWGLMMHISASELCYIGTVNGLAIIYLLDCQFNPRNKCQCNLNQNTKISFK